MSLSDPISLHDWDGLVAAGEFDAGYLLADTRDGRRVRLLAGD